MSAATPANRAAVAMFVVTEIDDTEITPACCHRTVLRLTRCNDTRFGTRIRDRISADPVVLRGSTASFGRRGPFKLICERPGRLVLIVPSSGRIQRANSHEPGSVFVPGRHQRDSADAVATMRSCLPDESLQDRCLGRGERICLAALACERVTLAVSPRTGVPGEAEQDSGPSSNFNRPKIGRR
jgi:hypothetical protein